ncbi:RNA ligase RtcB family protein [Parathalassolituus penaei]|uniref:3'-phosphate/5'-hydroxy nucleic acid ligase n=1 Tax=Parathalassolituus penaei TaxID=2997323 RepID=A0A9X3EC20_9GAMM|nr:RNA ligase RtcB family protein [Parathalassolituus penaei]MCY0964797.1 RNA ligase RtcB family protein [Parathalassolituus penaei]
MGNCIQMLADQVSLIASANTWIEGLATQQLIKTAELSGMQRVIGMPDLHPGRGYPVGAAFFSQGVLYPALVGSDIGCGMALWQTSLKHHKTSVDKLERKLGNQEQPLEQHWLALIQQRQQQLGLQATAHDQSLGTIGGGNHFAEFQQIDQLYIPAAELPGLDQQRLLLLVHSGSRGLGQQILTSHVEQHNHQGLTDQQPAQAAYRQQHDQALRWAELNRELIARRFLVAIGSEGEPLLDVNHNLVSPFQLHGQTGWLHRKGATPSDQGLVVIPGSRGDYSWLVRPIANPDLLCSLAHGAGRKWKRGDCRQRLSHKYSVNDLRYTRFGSQVICADRELLYDEAPEAYKPASAIMESLQQAGLVEPLARLKPVLTYKTRGECC